MVRSAQVRKWIRNLAALQMAQPTAKLVQKRVLPSPPDLTTYDDSSETESVESWTQHAEPSVRRPRGHASRAQQQQRAPRGCEVGSAEGDGSPPPMDGAAQARMLSPIGLHDEGETMRVARELLSLSALPFGGESRA